MTENKALAVSSIKAIRVAEKKGELDIRHWSYQAVLFHLDAIRDWVTLQQLVTRVEGGRHASKYSVRLAQKRMPQFKRMALSRNEVILTKNDGPRRSLRLLKLADRTSEGDKKEAQDVLARLRKHGGVTKKDYEKIAGIMGIPLVPEAVG